jgi:hypothetical protein
MRHNTTELECINAHAHDALLNITKHYDETDSFLYKHFCISVTINVSCKDMWKIQSTVEKTNSLIHKPNITA